MASVAISARLRPKKYQCTNCKRQFAKSQFDAHTKICGKSAEPSSQRSPLVVKLRTTTGCKNYCSKCEASFTKSDYIEHLKICDVAVAVMVEDRPADRRLSAQNRKQCIKCERTFGKSSYYEHIKSCGNAVPAKRRAKKPQGRKQCSKCERTFGKSQYYEHIKKCGNAVPAKSTKIFTPKSAAGTTTQCSKCKRSFSRSTYFVHIKKCVGVTDNVLADNQNDVSTDGSQNAMPVENQGAHSASPRRQCSKCERTFGKSQYYEHIKKCGNAMPADAVTLKTDAGSRKRSKGKIGGTENEEGCQYADTADIQNGVPPQNQNAALSENQNAVPADTQNVVPANNQRAGPPRKQCSKCRHTFCQSKYYVHIKKCGADSDVNAEPAKNRSGIPSPSKRRQCAKCKCTFGKSQYYEHVKRCGIIGAPSSVRKSTAGIRRQCAKCERTFSKSMYYVHIKRCGVDSDILSEPQPRRPYKPVRKTCSNCQRTLIKSTYYDHIKRCGKENTNPVVRVRRLVPTRKQCSKCQRTFAKSQYYCHIKKCGNNPSAVYHNINTASCGEQGCDFVCADIAALRVHLQNVHAKQMNIVEKSFKDKTEFDAWSYMLSKTACISWLVGRTKVSKTGCKRTYYSCNRSGKYVESSRPKISNKSHSMPKRGTVKCGRRCTASMIVTVQPDGTINAVACTTHYGHSIEAAMQRIHPIDRKIIASRYLQDVPIDKIVETNRTNAPNTSRLSLLSKRDVQNIVQSILLAKDSRNSVHSKNAEQLAAVCSIIEDSRPADSSIVEVCIDTEEIQPDSTAVVQDTTVKVQNSATEVKQVSSPTEVQPVSSAEEVEQPISQQEQLELHEAKAVVLRSGLISNWREIEGLLHCIADVDVLRRMNEMLNETKSLASVSLDPVLLRSPTKNLYRSQPINVKSRFATQPFGVLIRDSISVDPILTALVLDQTNQYEYSIPGLMYYLFTESSLDSCLKFNCLLTQNDIKYRWNNDVEKIDNRYHASFLQYQHNDLPLAEYMTAATFSIVRNIISNLAQFWRCATCKMARTDRKLIACSDCKNWHHWNCVGLSEENETNVRKMKKWLCKNHLCPSAPKRRRKSKK